MPVSARNWKLCGVRPSPSHKRGAETHGRVANPGPQSVPRLRLTAHQEA
jgi:hypothetical protein